MMTILIMPRLGCFLRLSLLVFTYYKSWKWRSIESEYIFILHLTFNNSLYRYWHTSLVNFQTIRTFQSTLLQCKCKTGLPFYFSLAKKYVIDFQGTTPDPVIYSYQMERRADAFLPKIWKEKSAKWNSIFALPTIQNCITI